MQPVLIRKDDHLIAKEKQSIAKSIELGQQAFDLFKPFDIDLTLQNIHDLIRRDYSRGAHSIGGGHTGDFIENFIKDKVIEKAGAPTFNGIAIKKTAVRDMIELPDTAEVSAKIKELANIGRLHFHTAHLEIVGGIVRAAEGAHDKIESHHTHFTQTEHGHQLAQTLLDLADKMQEYSHSLGKYKNGHHFASLKDVKIPGLDVTYRMLPESEQYYHSIEGGQVGLIVREPVGFALNLNFIRQYETKQANDAAKK